MDIKPEVRDLLIKLHDVYYPDSRPAYGRAQLTANEVADEKCLNILIKHGHSAKIQAIKHYREITNWGLLESKERIEELITILQRRGKI